MNKLIVIICLMLITFVQFKPIFEGDDPTFVNPDEVAAVTTDSTSKTSIVLKSGQIVHVGDTTLQVINKIKKEK